MLQVMTGSWALFLGMFMLMIGNGLQGTLLGLRGDMEGFTTLELSVVMSAYFVGFLFNSLLLHLQAFQLYFICFSLLLASPIVFFETIYFN